MFKPRSTGQGHLEKRACAKVLGQGESSVLGGTESWQEEEW